MVTAGRCDRSQYLTNRICEEQAHLAEKPMRPGRNWRTTRKILWVEGNRIDDLDSTGQRLGTLIFTHPADHGFQKKTRFGFIISMHVDWHCLPYLLLSFVVLNHKIPNIYLLMTMD